MNLEKKAIKIILNSIFVYELAIKAIPLCHYVNISLSEIMDALEVLGMWHFALPYLFGYELERHRNSKVQI